METPDAVALATEQVRMELEGGGIMTPRRMAEIAEEWGDDVSRQVFAGMWEDQFGG